MLADKHVGNLPHGYLHLPKSYLAECILALRSIEDGAMILIFLVGLQLGALVGAIFCIRYLRREIAADIGPKLKRIQAQLDNLESALNLALLSRFAELGERLSSQPLPPPRPPLPRACADDIGSTS
jgi:hypothetical protein